jgi:tyrosine-protein phosphatase YwqE
MWFLNDKVTVKDCGLLEDFCDCHCHLLPGVDDGVGKVDETLRILRVWEKAGVKEVWLTPHIMEDIPNEPSELRQRYEALKEVYQGPIVLRLAAEHMMDGLFLKRLVKNDVMTYDDNLNKGGKLLVETSYYTPPMNMTDVIERIKEGGGVPILAHPERYQYVDKTDYKRWKQRGVLLQLNVPSLVGAYGPMVQKKAEWLLKENMYDYCGSDTHSINQVEMFLNSEISKKTVKMIKNIAEKQEL